MPPPTLKLGIAVVQCAWGVRSVLSPTRPLPPLFKAPFVEQLTRRVVGFLDLTALETHFQKQVGWGT